MTFVIAAAPNGRRRDAAGIPLRVFQLGFGRASAQAAVNVPDRSPLKLELAHAIWEHCPQYAPQIVGPRKTLSERFAQPFRNQEQEQEQEQEQFLSRGRQDSKVRELGTARRGAAA